jgi:hypothetical protein
VGMINCGDYKLIVRQFVKPPVVWGAFHAPIGAYNAPYGPPTVKR